MQLGGWAHARKMGGEGGFVRLGNRGVWGKRKNTPRGGHYQFDIGKYGVCGGFPAKSSRSAWNSGEYG